MGYIDPNSGTHFYEPTDPLSGTAIATVLNTAQTADHNARLADRARITDLEENALVIHTIVPSEFITMVSGYTLMSGVQVVRRIGSRVEFSLRIQKTTGALGHGVAVATVNSTWAPIASSEWQLTAQQSGGAASAGIVAAVLSPSRNILTLNPNGQSNILAVSGFYHLV